MIDYWLRASIFSFMHSSAYYNKLEYNSIAICLLKIDAKNTGVKRTLYVLKLFNYSMSK